MLGFVSVREFTAHISQCKEALDSQIRINASQSRTIEYLTQRVERLENQLLITRKESQCSSSQSGNDSGI